MRLFFFLLIVFVLLAGVVADLPSLTIQGPGTDTSTGTGTGTSSTSSTSTTGTSSTSSTSSTSTSGSTTTTTTTTSSTSTTSTGSSTGSTTNTVPDTQKSDTPDKSTTTDATNTLTTTQSNSDSPSGSTPPADQSNRNNNNQASSDDTKVSTGTIVGLSVAGGVAVLGIVAFIIWKLTRKRFHDLDGDGEEIKWPELNNETHALPTRATGRAGLEDEGYDDNRVAPPRDPGNYGRASSTATSSMADLHNPYGDPFAVPPLPHNNPSQPYRDDPSGQTPFYDPYRGPVPQSLHDPQDGTEHIPMSTYSATTGESYQGSTGRTSPGPGLAYETFDSRGRASPAAHRGY